MKLFDTICNNKIPEILPIVPTVDVVAFPHMIIPLFVVDQRIIQGINYALEHSNKMIILLACKKQAHEPVSISPQDLFQTGTVATVIRTIPLQEGGVKVLVQGVMRARAQTIEIASILQAQIKQMIYDEAQENHIFLKERVHEVRVLLEKMSQEFSHDFQYVLSRTHEPDKIADFILSYLNLAVDESQELLEAKTYCEFFEVAIKYLVREYEMNSLQEKAKNKARESMNNAQKEFYLREQIKALKSELGEESHETDQFRTKLSRLKLSPETYQELERTINKFESLAPESAEGSVLRTYLECVFDLPWNIETQDTRDLCHAKKILDEEHFGLHHVKDRILDFLSVKLLSNESHSAILCFYGPPGVGKTSLAQSIANALGRKHFRVSVGGLKDEAEIRGHRRTYVGAIPGRFIKGLRQAQTKNPVVIIDEIDKIGQEVRGDPAAALLEVLDYQQNHSFYDYYVGLPFDISKCLFITTANQLDTIPSPLRDRMELIEMSAYTFEEKKAIAIMYFVPHALKECGVEKIGVTIEPHIIERIIKEYTCEAGVRDLERWVKKLGAKIARKYVETKELLIISDDNLESLLGGKRFIQNEYPLKKHSVGVSCGLCWTPQGGEIIHIETLTMNGSGKLTLTGQLGDVMKESAHTAFSYIKSHAQTLGITAEKLLEKDLHLHIPAGAIPKDGPSAGVAILISLLSAYTQQKINNTFALTGEIDLQGNVLPVGGIKEKVLAARRYGIPKVILPSKNKHDTLEIQDILSEIEIIFIDNVIQAIDLLLVKEAPDVISELETINLEVEQLVLS